ncbi:MAG: dihydropteroate synthase [Bacteroidales bacterium]
MKKQIDWHNGVMDLSKPLVMGILNTAPDSFYDGGKYAGLEENMNQVARMIREGASIVDVGAVSTRPGAPKVSEADEWQRLEPVLKQLTRRFPDLCISVDTWRSNIARKAVEAGAAIVNDISGGGFDEKMFETIVRLNVPFIMMHIQGTPQTMQTNPQYGDVVEEVYQYFDQRLEKLFAAGMKADVILDPGFGFGKNTDHNYRLLYGIEKLKSSGFPVLCGVSRKSMINRVLGTRPENALNGTTAVNMLALIHGADILRVHDVKEAVQVVKIFNQYRESGAF